MNEKKISAKPRAASKAPLSPRGKASKKTTATSADNCAEIEKTVSDILGAILDKKLGEIEKRIDARIEKAVSDITFEIAFAADGIRRTFEGTSLIPLPAIPATYDETTSPPRLVFNNEAWPDCTQGPEESYIKSQMDAANSCAGEIKARACNVKNIIEFLDTRNNGYFRKNIIECLLYFPRIAIDGEDVKIGALQFFKAPKGEEDEARIDEQARAPFDALLAAAMRYIENSEAEFQGARAELRAVRDQLKTFSDTLENCTGTPGVDCKEASVAAAAAIEAARKARRRIATFNSWKYKFACWVKEQRDNGRKWKDIFSDFKNKPDFVKHIFKGSIPAENSFKPRAHAIAKEVDIEIVKSNDIEIVKSK